MSDTSTDDNNTEIDRINFRIAESFLMEVDETWKDRGFNSRSEFIRYALREQVNHPEGAGFWEDFAVSEVQQQQGKTISSDELKQQYDLGNE
jgi:metal-responsive CopG/Arc/MetJ family transcriptional regulator